ncbi:hypoxanthine phosphoribosyltransferase [Chitinivibrio alkaliphilus]|uniref:Hypoxanthine phosphoribosyltransferase n=1 Tax=Chitinivibrio alkaliphilus ACht1 TaxID=1313304 RepID=U7D6R0_9BACT|nr:hypoxanthine phosphoribosyltransferase [Chitinivibrio alkaliphilus]ERP32204.1 hypoxanthine phosphoribosyltransferase [Chitinivibrio alkaliphilus ACht1]
MQHNILIHEKEITVRVQEVAAQISQDYPHGYIAVGLLKGGFIFMADLLRNVSVPVQVDFLTTSSYGNATESQGRVKIVKDIDIDIANQDILLVEDIVDTGCTLHHVVELLQLRSPRSIRIASFLNKPSRRIAPVTPDYFCFEIPDTFVFGYGLDYQQHHRNLPYLACRTEE